MSRKINGLKRILVIATSMVITLSLGAQASTVGDRTPDDNDDLWWKITGQFSAFMGGTVAGFIPEPFVSIGGEVVATTTDATLKFTAPVFGRLSNKTVEPNYIAMGDSNACYYKFTLQQSEAQHKNLFGFNWSWVPGEMRLGKPFEPDAWGPLVGPGEMEVFHLNSDVSVTLSGQQVTENEDDYPLDVVLGEGRHRYQWEAATLVNPILDIVLPVALIPLFIRSETDAGYTFSKFLGDNKLIRELIDNPGAARAIDPSVGRALAGNSRKILMKAWRKHASGELLALAGFEGLNLGADVLNLTLDLPTSRNSFWQTVTVLDTHTPVIEISESVKTVEAMDLGGTRLVRVYDDLLATLNHYDLCGRSTYVTSDAPNILPVGEETTITWTTTDLAEGEAETDIYKSGISSTASAVQKVTVVDTLPPIIVAPAGKVIESPDSMVDPTGLDLGWPMVIDLADPDPVITNDAPTSFANDSRLAIDWAATDDSDNSARQVQWVTAKSPGTNRPPSVSGTSAQIRTAETVDIRLDGIDPDVLPTSRGFDLADPLSFEIADYPDNGQFEAPLRPFFIEDFRLTPIGETEVKGARTSPLGDNAAEFAALPDPADPRSANEQRGEFLKERYCAVGDPVPLDFVFQPTYVHVTDDGTYYVRDKFWDCQIAAELDVYGVDDFSEDRISKWSKDRDFLDEFRMHLLDCTQSDMFTVDANGSIWWTDCGPDISIFLSAQDIQKVDKDFNNPEFYRFTEQPEVNGFTMFVRAVHVDTEQGLIFVNNNQGVQIYRRGLPGPSGAPELLGHLDIDGEENFLATGVDMNPNEPRCHGRELLRDGSIRRQFWITTDSQSNLYMSDACRDIIHKFRRTGLDDDGDMQTGEYVGWMGRCDANVPPWSGCNESEGVTRGFTCADNKCTRVDTFGTEPGQFQQPTHLAVDPNDILYVADYGNLRVQRFGSEGTFAGEAVSAGTGVNAGDDPGFVLGNMGPPSSVSVNSSSFYVMESENDADFFLHSFKTIPFQMIEADDGEVDLDGDGYADNSVILRYTSDYNFPGASGRVVADDHFTYRVNDGLADSAVSEGVVTVRRNYRPPGQPNIRCYRKNQRDTPVDCKVDEDDQLVVEFIAEDPDGVLGYDGLDILSYEIVDAAGSGGLQPLSADNGSAFYLYTPDPDFNGDEAFSFSVTDNTTVRPDGLVDVTGDFGLAVLPVPDPPVLNIDPVWRAGRGFPTSLTARFSDVDNDPEEPDPVVYVGWGDGMIEPQGDIVDLGDGEYDVTGPILTRTRPGTGSIFASHTFLDSRDWPVTVCLDSVDSPNVPICDLQTIEVHEATKVTATQLVDVPAPPAGTTFTLSLEVTNQLPEGWAGLDAPNLISVTNLPDGLAFVAADSRCTAGGSPAQVTCNFGDMTPGQTEVVDIVLRARIIALPVPNYEVRTEVLHGAFDVSDEIAATITIEVRWIDVDGDNMPDAWELLQFGNLGEDAVGDLDSDGLSNLDEYYAGADPHLADTDGDGLSDQHEYERYQTNPASGDTDSDGLPDVWEVEVGLDAGFANAHVDTDEDGLTNQQEYELDFDPIDPDMDDDDWLDGGDNCPITANTPQRDADADARGDACDVMSVVDLKTVHFEYRQQLDDLAMLYSVADAGGSYDSWVRVTDGLLGSSLAQYRAAEAGQDVLELQVLPNGAVPQFVISSERRSDRWPSIDVVSALDGRLVSQINSLPFASRLLATRPLPIAPSGMRQLAVLLENTATDLLEVQLIDADSGVMTHLLDLSGVPDAGRENASLAVMMSDSADAVAAFHAGDPGQGLDSRVVVTRASDGAILADVVPDGPNDRAIEMHAVPDIVGDGSDDIAVRLRQDDEVEVIRVIDLPSGTELSRFTVLDMAAAEADNTVYDFDVVDTGQETAIVVLTVEPNGTTVVSVRDMLSGNELYAPIFSGSPNTYRNASSVLADFGGAATRELALVMEDMGTGQHEIEIRDIQTGELLGEPPPAPQKPGRSGGGAMSTWVLVFLISVASCGRRRRLLRKQYKR